MSRLLHVLDLVNQAENFILSQWAIWLSAAINNKGTMEPHLIQYSHKAPIDIAGILMEGVVQ